MALGDVGPDGILESEAALARRFSVSRVTVRKALGTLQQEGLVVSRQGSGWYATRPVRNPLAVFPTEVAAHEAAGGVIQRRPIDTRWTIAPAAVRAALDLRPHERTLRFRRVNSADGIPYDLVTTWLPPQVGRDTSSEELGQLGAWGVLERLGKTPTRTDQTISAALATTSEAKLLGARTPLALMLLRRVGYTADSRPVALTDHRYPGGRVRLSVSYPGDGE